MCSMWRCHSERTYLVANRGAAPRIYRAELDVHGSARSGQQRWGSARYSGMKRHAPTSETRTSPRRSRRARQQHPAAPAERRDVLLYLAANPPGTGPLSLSEECAEIQRELAMSPHRDDLRFESRWAVSVDALMRHLLELDPAVIHLSSHGIGQTGLVLQGEAGQWQPVPARALAMIIEATAPNARVLVLNACYSADQADALCATVDCVIGMAGAIGDTAARAFAARFYGALGNRRSIGNAVAQGIAALAAKQLPDEDLPRCRTRPGVSADTVFLRATAKNRAGQSDGRR